MDTNPNSIITEDLPEPKKEIDPVEEAGKDFHKLTLIFNQLIKGIKKKNTSTRVLKALILGPFEEVPLYGRLEEDLLGVCKGLMYNRAIIEQYAISEHMKKLEQKEKEDGKDEN